MLDIYNQLIKKINKSQVLMSEPMSKHTSFKIGGPADFFVKIKRVPELQYILEMAKDEDLPVTIIGNGTNLLVKDSGIRGIVVKPCFSEIKIEEDGTLISGAGVLLPKLVNIAYENSYAGLEFASRNTRDCWWRNKNECRRIRRRNEGCGNFFGMY